MRPGIHELQTVGIELMKPYKLDEMVLFRVVWEQANKLDATGRIERGGIFFVSLATPGTVRYTFHV